MKTNTDRDAIRGSMAGGAIGDALGYAVEFMREGHIFKRYGSGGITAYELDYASGKALISDDTQMTLFTANGLLVGDTFNCEPETAKPPRYYVALAYQDWLKTQRNSIEKVNSYERCTREGGYSWLLDVPELYALRAPGNACLSSLSVGVREIEDHIQYPVNNSKGCGGIMRVAPLALICQPGENYSGTIKELDMEGAQIAAITHGHSLGYMPASVVTHIISRILTSEGKEDLKAIVLEARDTISEIFTGDPYLDKLVRIIDLAVQLSENEEDDLDNIHLLGEGWVAEETLGIALYCCLKYSHDFSACMIASVNHKGDSDSTGAVAGNILGALVGYDAIEEKWKTDLELLDVILEIADDLYYSRRAGEDDHKQDPEWISKYIRMHRFS